MMVLPSAMNINYLRPPTTNEKIRPYLERAAKNQTYLFKGLIRTSGDEMRNQDMNPATNTPAPPKMAMMGYVPGSLNQYFCLSAHLMEDVCALHASEREGKNHGEGRPRRLA